MLKILRDAARTVWLHLNLHFSKDFDDPRIRSIVEDAAAAMGVKPFRKIKVNSALRSVNAAVLGPRCRALVLTDTLLKAVDSNILTVDELKAVVMHEYAHCKLKHNLKFLLATLAVCTVFTVIRWLYDVGYLLSFFISSLAIDFVSIFTIFKFLVKRFELEADCLTVSKLDKPYTYVDLFKKLKAINGETAGLLVLHAPTRERFNNILKCVEKASLY